MCLRADCLLGCKKTDQGTLSLLMMEVGLVRETLKNYLYFLKLTYLHQSLPFKSVQSVKVCNLA